MQKHTIVDQCHRQAAIIEQRPMPVTYCQQHTTVDTLSLKCHLRRSFINTERLSQLPPFTFCHRSHDMKWYDGWKPDRIMRSIQCMFVFTLLSLLCGVCGVRGYISDHNILFPNTRTNLDLHEGRHQLLHKRPMYHWQDRVPGCPGCFLWNDRSGGCPIGISLFKKVGGRCQENFKG